MEIGQTLKARCAFYTAEFFGKRVIKAGARLKNPSQAAVYYAYHVAFFDNDGNLVACSSLDDLQDVGLKAGDSIRLSVIIVLPEKAIKKIASYQVVLHESDKSVAKK